MKPIVILLVTLFLLSIAFASEAQLPPAMRAKYTDAEYAAIMARNHIHLRYNEFPAVDAPVLRGQVKLGTELFDRYQSPNGWYYCHSEEGDCFDIRGLGVDPTGSCWVDKKHHCTDNPATRDISKFYSEFRKRADLGPPMTLTGQMPKTPLGNDKLPTASAPVLRGQVKIGTDPFDQYEGPYGLFYCHPKDGECFDKRGLGVDPSGSCWVDKERQCTDDYDARDISMFCFEFRKRRDLGPPMTLTGQLQKSTSTDEDSKWSDGIRKIIRHLFSIWS